MAMSNHSQTGAGSKGCVWWCLMAKDDVIKNCSWNMFFLSAGGQVVTLYKVFRNMNSVCFRRTKKRSCLKQWKHRQQKASFAERFYFQEMPISWISDHTELRQRRLTRNSLESRSVDGCCWRESGWRFFGSGQRFSFLFWGGMLGFKEKGWVTSKTQEDGYWLGVCLLFLFGVASYGCGLRHFISAWAEESWDSPKSLNALRTYPGNSMVLEASESKNTRGKEKTAVGLRNLWPGGGGLDIAAWTCHESY